MERRERGSRKPNIRYLLLLGLLLLDFTLLSLRLCKYAAYINPWLTAELKWLFPLHQFFLHTFILDEYIFSTIELLNRQSYQ